MTNRIMVRHFKETENCYYQINESPIKIDIHFPLHWNADHHTHQSGPDYCENCYQYGIFNDVFIGYCANCAEFVYGFTRGLGMRRRGIEKTPEEICVQYMHFFPDCVRERFMEMHYAAIQKESMWSTYMKDIETTSHIGNPFFTQKKRTKQQKKQKKNAVVKLDSFKVIAPEEPEEPEEGETEEEGEPSPNTFLPFRNAKHIEEYELAEKLQGVEPEQDDHSFYTYSTDDEEDEEYDALWRNIREHISE